MHPKYGTRGLNGEALCSQRLDTDFCVLSSPLRRGRFQNSSFSEGRGWVTRLGVVGRGSEYAMRVRTSRNAGATGGATNPIQEYPSTTIDGGHGQQTSEDDSSPTITTTTTPNPAPSPLILFLHPTPQPPAEDSGVYRARRSACKY